MAIAVPVLCPNCSKAVSIEIPNGTGTCHPNCPSCRKQMSINYSSGKVQSVK